MSEVFRAGYARSYDDLYAGKDYAKECDYLEDAIRRHGEGPVRRIVDFGCGTGAHALLLAKRGYDVTGLDLSPAMVEIARAKAAAATVPVEFQVGDVRTALVSTGNDAAIFMFAVLGYLTKAEDLVAALRNAHRHLRRGGLLMFDVWYGPAVLSQRPLQRARVIESGAETTIRISDPVLHADQDAVEVRLRLWQLAGDVVARTSDESHTVRYFFLPELTEYVEQAGFRPVAFTAFPHIDSAPDEREWEVGCIAVAT